MKHHIRTLWLSDIHLGTRNCKSTELLELLDYYKADVIYLVGDIIDMWQLKRTTKWWTSDHTEVIRKLLSKAKKGSKIIYVIGNHDEFLREFLDLHPHMFDNVSFVDEDVYMRADGRRLWIVHGDKYDIIIKHQKWIAVLGSIGYNFLLVLNTMLSKVRTHFGYPYWSLSQTIKHKVKDAVKYIGRFETILLRECKKENYDGVICGHIHRAVLLVDANTGAQYWNCGDFVESCSAIIEENDGTMRIIEWWNNKPFNGESGGRSTTLFESKPLIVEQNWA